MARIRTHEQNYVYKVYMTDMLQKITGAETRYYDLVATKAKVAQYSAEQVIDHIKEKLSRMAEG